MKLSKTTMTVAAFVAAAAVALFAANSSVQLIEDSSEIGVRSALDDNTLTWAEVEANGLQVALAGTAPSEAMRFQALSVAGSVVDAARILDHMEVEADEAIAPPRFSAEVLRNTSGLSIIGLIPQSTDRDAIVEGFADMSDLPVTDLLETADYPAPSGWEDALSFAITAIDDLPRAKLSITAGRVTITAIANSAEAKAAMEKKLMGSAPPALSLTLNITAPRPVITPFTLRFVMDEDGARFDACSADSKEGQQRILNAAFEAGLSGPGRCTIAMGVPSKFWAAAVEQAIKALAQIGGGSVTFSNADVTLIAAEATSQSLFDTVAGELENDLPDVFVLRAILPEAPDASVGPPEFTATLSPEGQVQLRGRLSDEKMREVTDSFARAKFGSDNVYTAARVVSGLPADWSTRVLTGLQALAYLNNGAITVTPASIALSGMSGDQNASDTIAQLMASRLGQGTSFDINVKYLEELDPVASLPTPEECEGRIGDIISAAKIVFEPGSATIDSTALTTMDSIAEVLQECGSIRLEIQGHTDSQGREGMNLSLSQARAESVLNELRARRVLTGSFLAKGYGEVDPIAQNDTEEGREANRRIEFRLIQPEASVPEGDSTLESVAESSDIDASDDTSDAEGPENE
ncbi:Peptidoglycan-associated lipoprotein [Roseobacter fucihabitans]|uniref:Peptidoglycan-associated lipoprotein n=1 Tax=Roseobacter fucihabitans TaxID=1537242 RepID=A0ABZ2BWK6_9RHOB|nr:OmpA family protein [Roseobacter litoralis]MBC6966861.1 Peptidoglycan-binding protein ArfA [Roseobacter litoralis]